MRLGTCRLACPSTIHGRSELLTRTKIENICLISYISEKMSYVYLFLCARAAI